MSVRDAFAAIGAIGMVAGVIYSVIDYAALIGEMLFFALLLWCFCLAAAGVLLITRDLFCLLAGRK